jgi:tetratricopeptide (TPR) repeat protein
MITVASPIGAIKNHALVALICALFFTGGMLRLNDLSVYTPDSCRYLIWGNSLAHGKGYLDSTQPVPDRFVVHAPLYALLIAPAELLFPMSLTAVKVWTLLWGLLALVLFYRWMLPVFGKAAAVCWTFVLAFNPAMLFFSTEVLSEAPFIAVVLILFILMEKLDQPEAREAKLLWYFVPLLAVLPLLRETGAALVAASVLVYLSKSQRKRALLVLVGAAAIFALWYFRNQVLVTPKGSTQVSNFSLIGRHFVTPDDSSIVNEFALRIGISFKAYAGEIGGLFFYPMFTRQLSELIVEPSGAFKLAAAILATGKYLLLFAAVPLAWAGLANDLRTSPTARVRALFGILYLLAICAYPVHDFRFLLPLSPLVYYYSAGGILFLVRKERAPVFLRKPSTAALALLLFMVPNIIGLQQLLRTNLEYRQFPEAILRHPTVPEMFRFRWEKLKSWIDGNMSDSAVIGSSIKDVAVVSGGRKVLEIDRGVPLPLFESLLRDHHVQYLLAPPRWFDLREYEFQMRESRRFWFEPVPDVPNLMRVHSRFLEPEVLSPPHQSFDTVSVTELLRKGRSELMEGRYEEGAAVLRHALQLAPGSADVLYQVMVSDLLLGDSTGARRVYQTLLGQPQAFSDVELARNQFDAADLLSKARSSKMYQEQAVKTFKSATIYWKSGYYRRAAELMNSIMETDTTYFVGLLWGFHFDYQLGDTVRARRFLSILERIDSANPVVVAFGHLIAIGDSLRPENRLSAEERSNLHLSAARICRAMQLYDESLDEAERALGESRGNVNALLFLARAFEQRSMPRKSIEMYQEVLRRDARNVFAVAKLDSLRTFVSRQ